MLLDLYIEQVAQLGLWAFGVGMVAGDTTSYLGVVNKLSC